MCHKRTATTARGGPAAVRQTAAGLLAVALAALVCFLPVSVWAEEGPVVEAPNIVFMLADDLGWRDTTPYGSTFYETPNIERLAARGMRFVNAYSASPLCSPTRASILTGQHPGRLRFTTPAGHVRREVLDPVVPERAAPHQPVTIPQSRTRLPNEYVTYAELLKQRAYATAFMGKWHLGRSPYLPEKQGFDVVVGGREHPGPPGGYFAPWPCDTLPEAPQGTHIDDVVTGEAVRFIEEHRDGPFLLNLWFYSVHAPFEAKPELIEKYREKAAQDPDNFQTNPVMGAMIETLDDNVGRVLDTLDRLELTDRTLVIFTSDNGGNRYNIIEGTEVTNNAPLRNGKGNIYEGGHRVPLIVSWPGRIAEDTLSQLPVSSVDFFPTVLDAVNVPLPADQACDGRSIWPALTGDDLPEAPPIYCHFPHNPPATGNLPATSVRVGDWKLIRRYGDGPDRRDRLELYNLAEDIGERNNLAAVEPDRAATLNRLIDRFLADTQALVPRLNPQYRPSLLGWTGNDRVEARRENGRLILECTGPDPWIENANVPSFAGPATLEITLRSNQDARCDVYYATNETPGFARERRLSFPIRGDEQWQTERVELQLPSRLTRLRIDPLPGPGRVDIDQIRLIRWREENSAIVAHHWPF